MSVEGCKWRFLFYPEYGDDLALINQFSMARISNQKRKKWYFIVSINDSCRSAIEDQTGNPSIDGVVNKILLSNLRDRFERVGGNRD